MYNTLGDLIIDYRKKHGDTQEQLANQLHVSRQLIYKWEKNQLIPSRECLPSLIDYLNIPPEVIFPFIDPQLTAFVEKYLLQEKQSEYTAKEKNIKDAHRQMSKEYIIGIILLVVILLIVSVTSLYSSKQRTDISTSQFSSQSVDDIPTASAATE